MNRTKQIPYLLLLSTLHVTVDPALALEMQLKTVPVEGGHAQGVTDIFETLQGGTSIMSRTHGRFFLGTNDNAPRAKYASAGYY